MKSQLYLFTAGSTLAVSLLASGCAPKTTQQGPPPAAVTVAPVEQKEIVEWNEFTGRTEPVDSVEIRPRTSGYIQEVRFQSGQLVKKGDVLFVIDPRWNQATFDQRQAEYDQARRARRITARTNCLRIMRFLRKKPGRGNPGPKWRRPHLIRRSSIWNTPR